VNEYQFPLFITSRQLLLMLDASLDPPYFFDRTEDGSLKVDIQGWTDGEGPLSILPLLYFVFQPQHGFWQCHMHASILGSFSALHYTKQHFW
jgi:hypothetical protein